VRERVAATPPVANCRPPVGRRGNDLDSVGVNHALGRALDAGKDPLTGDGARDEHHLAMMSRQHAPTRRRLLDVECHTGT
jgi:hypothetical protein